MERYFSLLKKWCDGLIARQITQFKDKELYGGILCPACALVHGRCYVFEKDRAVFTYEHNAENIDLIFPVVIKKDEPVTVKNGKTFLIKNGTEIEIDFEGNVPQITRFFNHVPGFEGCELKIKNVPQRITVTVEIL